MGRLNSLVFANVFLMPKETRILDMSNNINQSGNPKAVFESPDLGERPYSVPSAHSVTLVATCLIGENVALLTMGRPFSREHQA